MPMVMAIEIRLINTFLVNCFLYLLIMARRISSRSFSVNFSWVTAGLVPNLILAFSWYASRILAKALLGVWLITEGLLPAPMYQLPIKSFVLPGSLRIR